jgi:hypothetical protein
MVAVAAAVVGSGRRARESWGWRWDAPVVSIGGQQVMITDGVYGVPDVVEAVSHAITTISVPRGVATDVPGYTKTLFQDEKVERVTTFVT